MVVTLAEFSFIVCSRKRVLNGNADALSRDVRFIRTMWRSGQQAEPRRQVSAQEYIRVLTRAQSASAAERAEEGKRSSADETE
jgi:hypothetical protein